MAQLFADPHPGLSIQPEPSARRLAAPAAEPDAGLPVQPKLGERHVTSQSPAPRGQRRGTQCLSGTKAGRSPAWPDLQL